MKNIFSLLILIFTSPIFAQQSFPIKIQDFSDRYEAIVDVNEDGGEIQGVYDAYFAEYVIFINDKKTQKNIITSYAHDFPNYLLNNENELLSNHYEFPYGSQSVLIYEDFNFDGIKDFALMTGYFSCYGGPAFDIYLATKDGFQYNSEFSLLAHENCGLFEVDEERKFILAMTKSGCCYHEFLKFNVKENQPILIEKTTYSSTAKEKPFFAYRDYFTYEGNDTIQVTHRLIMKSESEILYDFYLKEENKRIMIFEQEGYLYFAIVLENGVVDYFYPQPYFDELEKTFVYDALFYNSELKTLEFQDQNKSYKIYESENSVSLSIVSKDDREIEFEGDFSSLIGSLKDLTNIYSEDSNLIILANKVETNE